MKTIEDLIYEYVDLKKDEGAIWRQTVDYVKNKNYPVEAVIMTLQALLDSKRLVFKTPFRLYRNPNLVKGEFTTIDFSNPESLKGKEELEILLALEKAFGLKALRPSYEVLVYERKYDGIWAELPARVAMDFPESEIRTKKKTIPATVLLSDVLELIAKLLKRDWTWMN